MPEDLDLDFAAAEVYAAAPGSFTATREHCAAENPDIAPVIRAWRKPTVGAWGVNLLASTPLLSEALAFAEQARQEATPHEAVDRSRLAARRRALVSALVTEATTRAASAGVALSRAAQDEVAASVNAAMADPVAAAAVLSGRLVRSLVPAGFGPVDLDGALAGSPPVPRAHPSDAEGPGDHATEAARAERAVREAEQAAEEAQRDLSRIDGRLTVAQTRVARLRERAAAVRADLAKAEAEAVASEEETASIDREREVAVRRVRETARASIAARTARDT